MWTWFKDFLFSILVALESVVGDWGLAIIVLTVILRIILLPLTLKQMKSTAAMQLLTPKLQEIQQKYADDPQRLNEEMMKFYAENKFNPAAGCLPMLVQMPIFIALFNVLRTQVPEGASFYNLVSPLTSTPQEVLTNNGIIAALPFLILVVLFGVSTLIPMLLQSKADKNMKLMGGMMSVMMLYFGFISPAGVLLYWDTSSLWGIAQQLIINKKTKLEAESEEADTVKPIEVDVVRTERKQRPKKKR